MPQARDAKQRCSQGPRRGHSASGCDLAQELFNYHRAVLSIYHVCAGTFRPFSLMPVSGPNPARDPARDIPE